MLRCIALAALVAAPYVAAAQTPRPFTADTLRGSLQFGVAPDVVLNGQPHRLSPGTRIQDAQGMGVLPGALIGQKHVVHYTLQPDGQIRDVWLLNAAEQAIKPWPVSPAQAAQWRFDAATQTWSRP